MVYKWCVVPQCTNTSINTPHKLFVSVPTNPKKRKMWLELAQRDPKSIVAHSNVFMCEDHFDMEKDTINLMQYKMGFSQKLLLSDDARPTKFKCQDNSEKRLTNAGPRILHKKQKIDRFQNKSPTEINAESFQYNVEIKQEVIEPEELPSQGKKTIITLEKSVQVTTKVNNHFGSKTVNTNQQNNFHNAFFEDGKTDGGISGYKCDHSSPFVSKSSTEDINFTTNKEIEKLQTLKNTMSLIDKDPFMHVGISKECYSLLIQLLHKHTNIKTEHILLCLTKIRLNSTFSELKDHLGISIPDASAIFLINIPILSSFLRKFIVNLDKNLINDVSCVIDCLEIDIEAPSETLYEKMTWSDYKRCHTVKYLISCTTDGLVNYVSQGFGGRTNDVTIVENCNFLDELQEGACILADRGFKHIEKVFHEKGMKILRPPSNSERKLSETEVRLTKIIASLRIHIEKVFMRIREFSMLKQNSIIDTSISCVLDDVIIIACALVNLQDSPIK